MKTKTNNAISACLIVLNEEKRIKTVLKNIKDYVDEIIVVDGGSKDGTVEIAKSLGAKVFFRKLNENFGAQRNFAIKKAAGDWIFTIDADETASRALLKSFKKLTRNKTADGYAFIRKNYINKKLDSVEDGKINLFRKYARYRAKLHEQPINLKNILKISDKKIYLNHYKTANGQLKRLMHYYQIIKDNFKHSKSNKSKRKYKKLLEITKKDIHDIVKKYHANIDLMPEKL